MRKLRNRSRNYNEDNKKRIRNLRKGMSVSEKALWTALRNDSIGFRFRRQYPIGPYSLDFYCPEVKVCIEVDGEQHAETAERDAARDACLANLGILTIRIPSLDLFAPGAQKFIEWIERIRAACRERSGQ